MLRTDRVRPDAAGGQRSGANLRLTSGNAGNRYASGLEILRPDGVDELAELLEHFVGLLARGVLCPVPGLVEDAFVGEDRRPGAGGQRDRVGWAAGHLPLTFGSGEFGGVPPERIPDLGDERLFVRVVPLELEYWGRPRTAFTLSLDHESRLFQGGDFEDEGFGLSVGFRYRIK